MLKRSDIYKLILAPVIVSIVMSLFISLQETARLGENVKHLTGQYEKILKKVDKVPSIETKLDFITNHLADVNLLKSDLIAHRLNMKVHK